MPITTVSTDTFLVDTISFVRDDLLSNLTDPISSTRPSTHKFVTTNYPEREGATYPLITIRALNIPSGPMLGMQSEMYYVEIQVEVRVWARNYIEKDRLTQLVMNRFRSNQYGASSFTAGNLHDFRILSTVDVDEDGKKGIKSKIITVKFNFVLGS